MSNKERALYSFVDLPPLVYEDIAVHLAGISQNTTKKMNTTLCRFLVVLRGTKATTSSTISRNEKAKHSLYHSVWNDNVLLHARVVLKASNIRYPPAPLSHPVHGSSEACQEALLRSVRSGRPLLVREIIRLCRRCIPPDGKSFTDKSDESDSSNETHAFFEAVSMNNHAIVGEFLSCDTRQLILSMDDLDLGAKAAACSGDRATLETILSVMFDSIDEKIREQGVETAKSALTCAATCGKLSIIDALVQNFRVDPHTDACLAFRSAAAARKTSAMHHIIRSFGGTMKLDVFCSLFIQFCISDQEEVARILTRQDDADGDGKKDHGENSRLIEYPFDTGEKETVMRTVVGTRSTVHVLRTLKCSDVFSTTGWGNEHEDGETKDTTFGNIRVVDLALHWATWTGCRSTPRLIIDRYGADPRCMRTLLPSCHPPSRSLIVKEAFDSSGFLCVNDPCVMPAFSDNTRRSARHAEEEEAL